MLKAWTQQGWGCSKSLGLLCAACKRCWLCVCPEAAEEVKMPSGSIISTKSPNLQLQEQSMEMPSVAKAVLVTPG